MKNYFFIGKNIVLVTIDKENNEQIEKIISFRNDPELGLYIGRNFPFTKEKVLEDIFAKDKVFLGIAQKDSDELIGFITLRRINMINGTGKLTVFIGSESNLSKGIGSEAIALMLDYAFKTLNLRKINADVFDFNERSIKCFKKLGFIEQGILKKEYFVNGEYHDDVLLYIFKEDWLKKL